MPSADDRSLALSARSQGRSLKTAQGRFDPFPKPSTNGRYLRIADVRGGIFVRQTIAVVRLRCQALDFDHYGSSQNLPKILRYGFEAGSHPSARLRDDARDGCAMNFEQAGNFGGRLAPG
jgi:hypothetical protein